MYGVALSVAACLRAGTQVDVAWIADPGQFVGFDAGDAVAITPGGGRIGRLLGGVLDGQLADVAGRGSGRLVTLTVSELDAMVAGMVATGEVRCLVVPASELPPALWDELVARRPVRLVTRLDGDRVVSTDLDVAASDPASVVTIADGVVTTSLRPVPDLVIVGTGPIPDALAVAAEPLGWHVRVTADAASATGSIAGLSAIDAVVVAAHDVELAGPALAAALASDVGYIGGLGGCRMQELRADWLAYRGVTELDRVHGPAGLDIGAESPAEIAISVLAEALAAIRRRSDDRAET